MSKKILVIVDEMGHPVDKPELSAVLTNMVETHLANLPGILLPVILKLPGAGGGCLDAYAFDNRALRVQICATTLREVAAGSRNMRSVWQLRSRVADLAANFRSRMGSSASFFRTATRSHIAVTAAKKRRRRSSELTPGG